MLCTIDLKTADVNEEKDSDKLPISDKTSDKSSDKSSQKSSEKILVLIESEPIISAKEIAEKLGIISRSVEKHIKNLRDKGILRRVGPDKGGHWEIVE